MKKQYLSSTQSLTLFHTYPVSQDDTDVYHHKSVTWCRLLRSPVCYVSATAIAVVNIGWVALHGGVDNLTSWHHTLFTLIQNADMDWTQFIILLTVSKQW